MRKKGYGFRVPHRQFVHRYLCLDPDLRERKRFRQKADQGGNQADGRSICEEFLRRLQSLHPGVLDCMCEAAIGTTLIFFRLAQERALQQARYDSASKDATCIQLRGRRCGVVQGAERDCRTEGEWLRAGHRGHAPLPKG